MPPLPLSLATIPYPASTIAPSIGATNSESILVTVVAAANRLFATRGTRHRRRWRHLGAHHHLVISIVIVVAIIVFGIYVITIASFALFSPFGIDLGAAGTLFTNWDSVSKPILRGFPRCWGLAGMVAEGLGVPRQLLLCNKSKGCQKPKPKWKQSGDDCGPGRCGAIG